MTYLFVGEKRSATAIRMNVTWRDGRLCAKNLHEALAEAGVDLKRCEFTNAYHDDGREDTGLIWWVNVAHARGDRVVALGQRASRRLQLLGVEHVVLIHPAARGAIRLRERYHRHVKDVLG
jgi:hypothetical protein